MQATIQQEKCTYGGFLLCVVSWAGSRSVQFPVTKFVLEVGSRVFFSIMLWAAFEEVNDPS